jgi:site-specific DNA-methyltransferase (adenine-specific)
MNGKDSILFSHKNDKYETPRWLFDLLDEEFHFYVDAAATKENSLCELYMSDSEEQSDKYKYIGNALTKTDWTPRCFSFWLNPPYSQIGKFIKKAYEESQKGAIVVCLIPSRTDTKYWHDYVMKSQEIRFVKGRLKFSNEKNSAPFPSCIVIFDHKLWQGNPYPWIGETIKTPIIKKD